MRQRGGAGFLDADSARAAVNAGRLYAQRRMVAYAAETLGSARESVRLLICTRRARE